MALRPGTTPRQTLDYLIDLFEPRIRNAFLAAIQDIVDNTILNEVIRAIENGDPEAAFRALGFSNAAMEPLVTAIEQAFESGGVMTGDNFPKYLRTPSGRAVFRFDVRNSRAEAWLRDHSGQLITRISNEVRENVRSALEQGMLEGVNPRSVARNIVGHVDPVTKQRTGGLVGLTPNQQKWVSNTRRDLLNLDPNYFNRELRDKRFDRTVAKAIAEERALPMDVIEKLTNAYKNKALKYRGDMIGRTEAIQALNQSEWEAVMQAVDMGALRRQDVSRHWDAAGDTRTRWSHMRMDRKYNKAGVEIDEPFVSPSGARMMFPGDTSLGAPGEEVINCRCRVRLKVDFLARWNDGPQTPRGPIVPPAQAVKPPVPIETPEQRNTRLDGELKSYVLDNGRRENREFLWAYDRKTGEKLGQNLGTTSHVAIPEDMAAAMLDHNAEIVAHHNHPSSSSFSWADLFQVTNSPGLAGLWAHGHNGSSYYAEGVRPLAKSAFDAASNQIRNELQTLINNAYQTDKALAETLIPAAGKMHGHAVSMLLQKQKYITYSADLQNENVAAFEKLEHWFKEFFK